MQVKPMVNVELGKTLEGFEKSLDNLTPKQGKYNVAFYDYGDEMQVRFYEKRITTGKDKTKSKASKTNKQLLDDISKSDDGNIEHFENILRLMDKEKERSMRNSANRAKNKLYELARANHWEYFVTLTFDPKKIDSTDYDLVVNKMSQWLDNTRKNYSPNLKYIMVPELHEDGKKYHFHGLFSDVGNLKLVDGGHKDNANRVIYNIGSYRLGWTTATIINDPKKASNYVSKYMTKTLCERLEGKKKYWSSRNLKKPTVTKIELSEDEKKDLLLNFASQIQHDSHVDVTLAGYNQRIDYYELKITQNNDNVKE